MVDEDTADNGVVADIAVPLVHQLTDGQIIIDAVGPAVRIELQQHVLIGGTQQIMAGLLQQLIESTYVVNVSEADFATFSRTMLVE